MISVLIPVYQRVVVDLVEALLSQLKANGVPFEVVVMDDGSEAAIREENALCKEFQYVRYIELERNVGRSAIRNMLASEAKYDLLLFLDCDVSLPDDLFIKRYLEFYSRKQVTVGGIAYSKDPPVDKRLFFRWKYGHAREAMAYTIRQKQPYHSFKTANFCISRALFLKIQFSDIVTGYGHEDTLFGFELARQKIPILHIDNPVYHDGLEDAATFLTKSEEAVQNLHRLYHANVPNLNIKQITLLKHFLGVKRYGISAIFALTYKVFGGMMRRNLMGGFPSIFIFSLYKLCYFSYLNGKISF